MCPSRKQPWKSNDQNFKKWPASSICFILADTCRNPLSPLTFQWSPECPHHVFHDFSEISAPHRKRCSLAAWSRKYSNRWVQPLDIYQLIWTIDDLGFDNLPAGMHGWNFQPLLLARLGCASSLKWRIDHPVNVIPSVSNKIQYHKVSSWSPYDSMNSWDAPSGNTENLELLFCNSSTHFQFGTAPLNWTKGLLIALWTSARSLGAQNHPDWKARRFANPLIKWQKAQEKNIVELFSAGRLLVVKITHIFPTSHKK